VPAHPAARFCVFAQVAKLGAAFFFPLCRRAARCRWRHQARSRATRVVDEAVFFGVASTAARTVAGRCALVGACLRR
jgi:hypothetical protein